MVKNKHTFSREEFNAFYKENRPNHSKMAQIKAKNDGKGKIAVVISKKVAKLATSRNNLKRRLKYAVLAAQKSSKSQFSVIFIAKPGIGELDSKELQKIVLNSVK